MTGKNHGRNKHLQNGTGLLLTSLAGFILLLLLSAVIKAGPQAARAAATPMATPERGKLVFLLTTGVEDRNQTDLCLHYALTAVKSGHLAEVAVLADGGGLKAFVSGTGPKSPGTVELVRQAQAAGVRLIVSAADLRQAGLTAADLTPEPNEVVADGAAKIAELVGQGYEVVRF
jgi:uncharacterized protein